MRIDFPGVVGTIEVYMDVMRAICGDTKGKSMIDLMCAFAPNTPRLGFDGRTYVDIMPRKLDHPEEQSRFFQMDILNIEPVHHIMTGIFADVAICSDGIEHLTYDDGWKLIDIMEKISHKQILFTPTTEIFKMVGDEDKEPEAHRSLWKPEDFPDYASIVFPDYHKVWNGGAFFFFKTPSLKYDFDRVVEELNNMPWAQKKP